QPNWEDQCLAQSGIEKVFLTNDFDDPLVGFNTQRYIPCLRTDDLVFHLAKPEVRKRLATATNMEFTNTATLKDALGRLFTHFKKHDAKACAISLPPWFSPREPGLHEVRGPLHKILSNETLTFDEQARVSEFVFWSLTE